MTPPAPPARSADADLPRRLARVLGGPGRTIGSRAARIALVVLAIVVLLLLAALWGDPRPSLRHVNVTILSGAPSGNYHAIVERVAAEAARRKGRVRNAPSAGSVENLDRLAAAIGHCDVQFALVQDGVGLADRPGLELVGRLPRPESLIVLGREAGAIHSPGDLHGRRLGIGPRGSGTEALMRRLLVPLQGLDLAVSEQPIDQQLAMLERGELDLGAMVIAEDAALVADAVARRNLQMLALPDIGSLAQRLPFARVGTIEAGRYDYVRKLPPADVAVLQVDTLLVGNGCASNSATQGVMQAVAEVFPRFVRHNKDATNTSGLPLATGARGFFDDDGPDPVGRYLPWVVDIMPVAMWVQAFVGLSLLFSGMTLANRFQLSRIDAHRTRIERDIAALFGAGVTVGDIEGMTPEPAHCTPAARAALDGLVDRLAVLAERCRRQSLSLLVPMGEEMAYRYQESLIFDLLHALRAFRARLPAAASDAT